MAKLARENRLRERRLDKEAKRDARKRASSDQLTEGPPEAAMADSPGPDPLPAPIEPAGQPPAADDPVSASGSINDTVRAFGRVEPEPTDPRDKEVALLRLRNAPDEELAVFEGTLRDDALKAGATEGEMRDAQGDHPGHGA